jgi:DNA (cytosine-5)-methyltransferase 1
VNYYNEIDPGAAAWLRELIKQGRIPPGEVDTRSIADVSPNDIREFVQCHFFAGVGGWSRALELAGWPASRPVWTGSCPCQPFSQAGEQRGTEDARHLWPELFRLIKACNPSICFGEQVASSAGREWFDGIRTDLEGVAYEVGGSDLCAAGIGSPQIRQRLYWIAVAGGMGNALRERRPGQPLRLLGASHQSHWQAFDIIRCLDGKSRRIEPGTFPLADGIPARVVRLRGYGNAIAPPLAAEFIGAWLDIEEDMQTRS